VSWMLLPGPRRIRCEATQCLRPGVFAGPQAVFGARASPLVRRVVVDEVPPCLTRYRPLPMIENADKTQAARGRPIFLLLRLTPCEALVKLFCCGGPRFVVAFYQRSTPHEQMAHQH
jgi:hypothetical protein